MAARVLSGSVSDDDVRELYEEVRNDASETLWAVFKYGGGKTLEEAASGVEYEEFLSFCGESDRLFGYVAFETGDEMSRRKKFAFITWIGPSVTPLKKAAVSTDKAFIKAICNQFGKEILADELKDIQYDKIYKELERASGAAYGTGK